MGLLLFLNGYSSAAGLHGGREGGPIGRYKHSHRPILLGLSWDVLHPIQNGLARSFMRRMRGGSLA